MQPLQRSRLLTRSAFFALFVLAPPLDLFRLDLSLGHFVLFGHAWTLGLDPFVRGETGAGNAMWNLLWRGALPLFGLVGIGLGVAWRYGRLYCGWLCPHFSVVETVNALMLRSFGRLTLWERTPHPGRHPDGRPLRRDARLWPLTGVVVLGFALLWSVVLLTYLLPPSVVYGNLWALAPTRNQALFIAVAAVLFIIDFTLARHLFCRYGCAVGLFQSLAWMANPRAMRVGFDRRRARGCLDCDNACDHACPMRLKPRTLKRHMFTCTQCGQCLSACAQVQAPYRRAPLLQWVAHECAAADGRAAPASCFAAARETP